MLHSLKMVELIKLCTRLYEDQHDAYTLSSPNRILAGSCLSNRPQILVVPVETLMLIKEQSPHDETGVGYLYIQQ